VSGVRACGRAGVRAVAAGRVWRCGACGKRVSRTAGTIFQDTRTPLTVWFAAAWYMTADPAGVSALTMQKLLGLGSYQTAWTMLHRYRTAMIRPGREVLTGRVEVDETFLGGDQPGVRGRGALGKTLVVVAVELRDPRGYGRARMSVIDDAAVATLHKFLVNTVEPGSTVVTDGWAAYPKACRDWFVHEPHPVSGSGHDAHELLPAVHRVASLCKRWLLGHPPRRGAPGAHAVLPRRVLLPLQPPPLPRTRTAVLPAPAVRRRRAAVDLPAAGGQPPPESDQAARSGRAAIPAQQPRPATPRPALAGRRAPRLRQRGDGSEMDSPLFKNARSNFSSEFSVRSLANSARSDSLRAPSPASWHALNAFTHRPNVASLIPSSRATVATARPVLITSLTTSSLYSGVNSRRCLPMMNILAYKVSTVWGEGQASSPSGWWPFMVATNTTAQSFDWHFSRQTLDQTARAQRPPRTAGCGSTDDRPVMSPHSRRPALRCSWPAR